MLIAVANNDPKSCAQVRELLASHSYEVSVVGLTNGLPKRLLAAPPALLALFSSASQLCVPGIIRKIRNDSRMRRMPILCVDSKADTAQSIACLDAGADDFINRPFNPQIFLARVRAQLRRRIWSGDAEAKSEPVLRCGGLSIGLTSRQVSVFNRAVEITRLEFDLLAYLLSNGGRAIKREELLEAIWHYPEDVVTRTLDKHVENLRRKLAKCGSYIHTVHGVGYIISEGKTQATSA